MLFRSIPKNRYGIIANNPAKIQLKVTVQSPSLFLISLTDLTSDAPGIIFFNVTESIKAEAPAIIKGRIAFVSLKIIAIIIGTNRTKLKYIIAREKVYAK